MLHDMFVSLYVQHGCRWFVCLQASLKLVCPVENQFRGTFLRVVQTPLVHHVVAAYCDHGGLEGGRGERGGGGGGGGESLLYILST